MPSTLAQRLARRDEQRFVGREAELAYFGGLFVDDPPASVVLIHGVGGIGKSTLLREIARQGERCGWQPRLVEGRELAPVPGDLEDALAGVLDEERPLILFDTYERMSALGGYLRQRLIPSLPDRAIVVLAGRKTPDPEWFQNGWEQICVDMEIAPLRDDQAHSLLSGYGVDSEPVAESLIAWADGSPLALALAAEAVRDGGAWQANREQPNLVRAIIRRLAQTDLDGGNLDVVGVAALARCTNARLIRDVLPEVDPDEAEAWLRSRTFAEPLRDGVTMHDLVRRAVRADLRRRDPERERELRRRIADHLHARALRGEPRLSVDLAELIESPVVRWGFGAEGSVRYRVDEARDGDGEQIIAMSDKRGYEASEWWTTTEPFFESARDRIVTVRDASEKLSGFCICVTPANAPTVADDDPLLGPWLAYARREWADESVILWRDSVDLIAPQTGEIGSPITALMNTAAILRSGEVNPRYAFLPIDPENAMAVAFSTAVGARHIPELDIVMDGVTTQCHVLDYGVGGKLGAQRAMIYAELGLAAPPVDPVTPSAPAPPASDDAPRPTIDADVIRDALRSLDQPLELSTSPLATGVTPEERAASVRAIVADAVANAFGDAADEQLLRRIIERGYLDPTASHESAASDLNVSRATYFRRLRIASQRVADYVLATRAQA